MSKFIYILIASLIVTSLFYLGSESHSLAQRVKSGELILFCNLSTGRQQIDPNKVEDFDSDSGRWFFINGSSINCTVYNNRSNHG